MKSCDRRTVAGDGGNREGCDELFPFEPSSAGKMSVSFSVTIIGNL